jgi:hypothetical protein
MLTASNPFKATMLLIWIASSFALPSTAVAKRNILFIHHSVGESIIRDGRIRAIFTEAGFDFWDHGYNHPETGLKNEKGEPAGSYRIPDDNTTPYGYARLFALDPNEDNAFNKILNNHDIILFKSCFPVSKIQADNPEEDRLKPWRRSFANYKRHYLAIRDNIVKFPEKIFIIMTPPPLHPKVSGSTESTRARAFTKWLQSQEYLNSCKNFFVFDLFDILADPESDTLRGQFQLDPSSSNSHPNPVANLLVSQKLSDFVINVTNAGTTPSKTPTFLLESGSLIREVQPLLNLTSVIAKNSTIKRLFWSDLEGRKGELELQPQTPFIYQPLRQGVTTLLFTATSTNGFRTSAIIGVRYNEPGIREKLIFKGRNISGTIRGITRSERQLGERSEELVIKGDGSWRRIVIDELAIDISEFDPDRSIVEMSYDQGKSTIRPRLVIPGIFSEEFSPDDRPGYQQIRFQLRNYEYLLNSLNRIIIKGKWEEDATISIQSVRLVQHE